MPLLPIRVHIPTELQTAFTDEALPHPIILLHPRTLAESASAPLLDAASEKAVLLEGRPSKSALESGQACYASELVAQGIRILVFATHEVEARAAGGGEVDEDVC